MGLDVRFLQTETIRKIVQAVKNYLVRSSSKKVKINNIPALIEESYNRDLKTIVDGSDFNLEEIQLKGVTKIGKSSLSGWKNLKTIVLPQSVTSIEEGAFENSEIASMTIPESVTSIGDRAFYGCTKLTRVYYGGSEESWSNVKIGTYNDSLFGANISFAKTATEANQFEYSIQNDEVEIVKYNGSDTEVTIPLKIEGYPVTSIGDYAFKERINLTSVIIPNSIIDIGDEAFWCCYNLTSITIPDSVINIGRFVLAYCTSLTSVVIPNSVTSIDSYAFLNCTSLTSVTIPDSVTSIGSSAFENCTSITDVYYNGIKQEWDKIEIGSKNEPLLNATINYRTYKMCGSNMDGEVQWVIYEDGELKITDKMNENMKDYTSSSGAPWALESTIIKTVTICDGVTRISNYAFNSCISLTSVTIPDSVTSIGERAFFGCIRLENITIPDSVTLIDEHAFYDCYSLTSIIVDKDNQNYSSDEYDVLFNKDKTVLIRYPEGKDGSYTIPDSVTNIGDFAFHTCRNLTSVTIGNGVTNIGNAAFYGCTGLVSVAIPNSITVINPNTFRECTNLTSITIPNSVTSINGLAFEDCEVLVIYTSADSYPVQFAKIYNIPVVLV